MLEPDILLPTRVAIGDPARLLVSIGGVSSFHLDLDRLDSVEMWALVALCARARKQRPDDQRGDVYGRGRSKASRFAHAVGFDAARDGVAPPTSESGRTVAIQRVTFGESTTRVAQGIALLAVPAQEEGESREALAYVVEELLRNVLQHSGDPLGAVVGAQRMDAGKGGYHRATAQVAVADTGRGIPESLKRFHGISTAEVALEKALRPHLSGTFPEGQTGSHDNAGLGLFFTAEMAKLTAGRLLLATRGGALLLSSDEQAGTHRIEFLEPGGTGFPGTLAVFELPLEVQDRDALLDVIRKRASDRTPASAARAWLSHEPPPAAVAVARVRDRADDLPAAAKLAEKLRADLSAGRPVALDFEDVSIATQSFLHALLFQAVRVGWAMGAKIYVVGASPAIRSGLDFLESYALRG